MADCTGKITAGFTVDCNFLPVAGLTANAVLINFEDIDRGATTKSTTPGSQLVMTNLQLKPGTTGYLFTGIKQSNGKSYEFVPVDNLPGRFSHSFTGRIFNPSAANKEQLRNLALGAKYVMIVEQLWKGEDNEEAFEVLGFDAGLILSEATNNSAEDSNTISIVLSSEEGIEEPNPPYNLLETDYPTTKTAFDNLFAEASV
jgi:hypothetical protein